MFSLCSETQVIWKLLLQVPTILMHYIMCCDYPSKIRTKDKVKVTICFQRGCFIEIFIFCECYLNTCWLWKEGTPSRAPVHHSAPSLTSGCLHLLPQPSPSLMTIPFQFSVLFGSYADNVMGCIINIKYRERRGSCTPFLYLNCIKAHKVVT